MFISKSHHIYYIYWYGTGSCLECSSLHSYRAVWQKQMALQPWSPQVETEEHQHCRKKEKKPKTKQNKWKRKGMYLWKYRREKCLWKPSGSFYHSCSFLLTPIKFFWYLLQKKVLFCVVLLLIYIEDVGILDSTVNRIKHQSTS